MTGMSLTNRMKSSGLSILPCVVPASSWTTSERVLPILTWMVLSLRNEEIILCMSLGSSISWSFLSRPLCHSVSKAFSTSMRSRAASFFSLTFFMYLLMWIVDHYVFTDFLVWLLCPLPWVDDIVVFYEFLDPVGDDFLE